MIQANNIVKQYYTLTALNNISLTIAPGSVLGLLGPNGAGKTTLMKIIAGLIHPDKGTIRPFGTYWPKIGYKPERLLYPNHLKVRQYLSLTAQISNIPSRQIPQICLRQSQPSSLV